MILKKSLRSKKAQAMSEYIIILLIITGLVIAGSLSFLGRVSTSLEDYHNSMVDHVAGN